jgi:putative RNA 2'-phosphotransferase
MGRDESRPYAENARQPEFRPEVRPEAGGLGGPIALDKSLVRFSKFLSLVLRHDPSRIGLRIEEAGWADVEELLAGANRAGVPLTRELLQQVVEQNDKRRFALSPDGRRIRASQGHSIPVDLQLEAVTPPDFLYHGTASHVLDSIREDGLIAGKRNHVHLSIDRETARAVGKRHGRPVVLSIRARVMERDGYSFYRSANGVWLTQNVPTSYIDFSEEAEPANV